MEFTGAKFIFLDYYKVQSLCSRPTECLILSGTLAHTASKKTAYYRI